MAPIKHKSPYYFLSPTWQHTGPEYNFLNLATFEKGLRILVFLHGFVSPSCLLPCYCVSEIDKPMLLPFSKLMLVFFLHS
jgi:hypothetical protein